MRMSEPQRVYCFDARIYTACCRVKSSSFFFFFNDTATTEIYPLSLHDALPISCRPQRRPRPPAGSACRRPRSSLLPHSARKRSEEHTSELQSRQYLVCRLLLGKKKICLLFMPA